MNKYSRPILSLIMVIAIIFYGIPINANAQANQGSNFTYSEVKINESIIDTFFTNNSTNQVDVSRSVKESDGTYSYYGWYNVGNDANYMNKESDFTTTVINGSVFYKEKGGSPILFATLDDKYVTFNNNNAKGGVGTFPTPWVTSTQYGNVATDYANGLALASLLASVVGLGTPALFMGVASYIIAQNVSTTYYKKVHHYRAYDSCIQQSYYEAYWYKNSNYTGLIDTTTTPISETYLCRIAEK